MKKKVLLGIVVLSIVLAGCTANSDVQKGEKSEEDIIEESTIEESMTEESTTVDSDLVTDVQTERTEILAYSTEADITHDGIDDFICLYIYAYQNLADTMSLQELLDSIQSTECVKVFRGVGNGNFEDNPCYTSGSYSIAHVGNGTICLTQKDGQDYLLLCSTYANQGFAEYSYEAIYIDDEKGIVVEDEARAEFAIVVEEHELWKEWPHSEDVLPEFKVKIAPWLENAIIIASLDIESEQCYSSIEQECPANLYFDTVWERYIDSESAGVDWFSDYNGEKVQRVVSADGDDYSPAYCNDVIFYKADQDETLDTVIVEMKKVILEPLTVESEERPFTVLAYNVDFQKKLYQLTPTPEVPESPEPIQWISEYDWNSVADEVWLLPSLEGYYSFDGTDFLTMEEMLEAEPFHEVASMVSFFTQGSEEQFYFILMRQGDVYRLQRAEGMEKMK